MPDLPRLLITAGPTREYLDDVRYLSNASSGKMGYAIAEAAAKAGYAVTLVSGPVDLTCPTGVDRVDVETTAEMRKACMGALTSCEGVIAAAAVCDYRPATRIIGKLAKTGGPMTVEMIETDDVLAEIGRCKEARWVVGFALEAENARERALQKLRAKNCDWIVVNDPTAIGSDSNSVELMDPAGAIAAEWTGPKSAIAASLIDWLHSRYD
ncbi:phosphopantothenoylcysteine decarboxylase domain-containing protein [Stratiformator vulcanicus]|uniref:Coenzyme A biosynthesis bifunctional protein CoaBC n=1 Tax=Stratiformator vulcanicus TaxID=2527980 RepID=A0A517R6J2_9PLAN|nr:phosphopantothenoylcysteine decarboxylase [Stratiformator vulcanicus]QDT39465.1 Coenzyme A biosynthesis bifunctional protein CoaBC [Stratiformator vulcanicus]